MFEPVALRLAAIVILGIGAQWLAWRFRLPSIVLLLAAGFAAGPFSGFLDPNALLGDLLLPLVSVSVAIILFEGGLTLNTVDLTQIRRVLLNLISIGVAATWLIAAAAAYFLLGFDLPLALLLGAILTVSGPTVVLPLLRHVQPVGQVNSILRWEGIVVDPVGAALAVIVFEAVTAQHPGSSNYLVIAAVAKTVTIGGVSGVLGAKLVTALLQRHWIPDALDNAVTLMFVVTTFTAANYFQAESGLLAVTLMGIFLANQKAVSVKHIMEFKENLRVLLLAGLFILLAARLELEQLTGLGVAEALFVLTLIFVARPLAVSLSCIGSQLSWRERLFLAWMAPRGIVAAAVSSVFAIKMISVGYAQADQIVPVTFSVIIATVAIYGFTAKPLSHWLQVAQPHSDGFLIVGAHSWAREIAGILQREECRVLLIDTNRDNVATARMEGLPACYASVLSPDLAEEIDLTGLGRLLALTSNDEVNSLAALHFGELFGRKEVYQLQIQRNGAKDPVSRHLRGRLLFGGEHTYRDLSKRFMGGGVIKRTSITGEFSYESFCAMYRSVVPLFIVSERGEITVVTSETRVAPGPGQAVIALVHPLESARKGGGLETSDQGRENPEPVLTSV